VSLASLSFGFAVIRYAVIWLRCHSLRCHLAALLFGCAVIIQAAKMTINDYK